VSPESTPDATRTRNGGELCLAICSATRVASAALLEGDKLVVEHAAETDRHQAECLLPLIDRVLTESGVHVEELAGIGLSIGPGSFTSLRIGVATVKGLVFGTRVKVIPVSTLQALAAATGVAPDPAMLIVGSLNAQRGEVYAASFGGSGEGFAPREDVLPERVYTPDELAELLPAACLICGDGAVIVAERLRELRGDDIHCAIDEGLEPSAASIGRLALARLAAGEAVEAGALAPRYVRRAEAEVTRTSLRFEP
jgi:tRNA threonylcarbamoyladenosine biosynthesis protein TsaB